MDTRRLARNIASGDRARARMRLSGLTPNGYRLWCDPETGELRAGYPDYDKVLAKVRERTRKAAQSKASRIRITKPRARRWDAENEKPRMRRLYPRSSKEEILQAFPGRSWSAIQSRAHSWRIFRNREKPKPRENPLLDAIVQRAFDRGIGISELDAMVGSRNLFRNAGASRISDRQWRFVFAAIDILEGELRARWP